MKNKEFVMEWLKRAKSNLEKAKLSGISKDILYEDLCFDAQQAVEKSLKAFLISLDQQFPRTHSIAMLLELIAKTGIEIPKAIEKAIDITEYGVKFRYPGEQEPVSRKEYQNALNTAEDVFQWVNKIII